MRPVRLFAKHYGPYEEVSWEVPSGVTAIIGRNDGEGISSNGAGKTMLLELLPLALFGPSSALSEHLTTGGAATTCEVGVEFDHVGARYRIRRTYVAQGRGKTTLDFERQLDGDPEGQPVLQWEPLAHERQDQTQQEIERLLGIAETTFEQSVFSRQFARHFANPELPPRERKEILAQTLGLGVYDTLLAAARRDGSVIDTQLATLRGSLETWERQAEQRTQAETDVADARARAAELEAAVATWTARHDELRTSYEQARQARDKVTQAQGLVAARAQTLAGYDARVAAAAAARTSLEALRSSLEALELVAVTGRVAEARGAELAEAKSIRDRALAEHSDLSRRAEVAIADARQMRARAEALTERAGAIARQLETPAETCDRCGNPVAGDAAERVMAGLRADMEALDEQRRTLTDEAKKHDDTAAELQSRASDIAVPDRVDEAELERLRAAWRAGQGAETEAAATRARIEAAEQTVAETDTPAFAVEHEEARDSLAAAKRTLGDLEASVVPEEHANELARDTLTAKVEADRAQQTLDQTRGLLGAAEERLRAATAAAEKATGAIAERQMLERRSLVLAELARLYGRDGIPALIMESTAIPKIEREAERVLQALGVPFRVELRTQTQQKTTDRLKDTLDVVVHEPNGERRYETYSGGERARINVALRIALARLLAHRRGAAMEVFALDEVEHLDAAGVVKLAEMLRDLQREIPVVWFISHVDSLTESFDQTVTVVREDGRSRIEVAA